MELCKLGGIKMSSRLIRNKTTHLLCCVGAGESDKLINARAWGSIQIITIEWLLQSIRTGQRAVEAEYLVDGAPAAPGPTAAVPDAGVSEPSDAQKGTAPQPPAAADPRPAPKPQGDEPDSLIDFLAQLTSVAKATGKRCASWCYS